MRSFSSGLEVFIALGYDFVLRRNVRVALNLENPPPFVQSTHGSHHVRLVSHVASLWNELAKKHNSRVTHPTLTLRATLPSLLSEELFGLVPSEYSSTFAGLLEPKSESVDLAENLLGMAEEEIDMGVVAAEMDISPGLFLLPHASSSLGTSEHLPVYKNHLAHTPSSHSIQDTSIGAAARMPVTDIRSPTHDNCAMHAP
jgi:hypothetical protein